jgi:hypothetical protein
LFGQLSSSLANRTHHRDWATTRFSGRNAPKPPATRLRSLTNYAQATAALYTLRKANPADLHYEPDEPAYTLDLFNAGGDGLALQGTRREILDYPSLVTEYVKRETDPRPELNQALKRLHTLRQERAAAHDDANYSTCHVARLDEQEVDLLNDVAEAAEHVNDELSAH